MNEDKFVEICKNIYGVSNKELQKLLKKLKKHRNDLIKDVSAVVALYSTQIEIENEFNDTKANNYVVPAVLTLALIKVVKDNLNKVSKDEQEITVYILRNAANMAYTETYKTLSKVFGKQLKTTYIINKDWNILRDEFVDRALNATIDGKRFSDRIWSNTNDIANRIYNDVLDIVRNGKRPDEIARRIKDDYGVKAYQAKRLVNTELARVVNEAQLEVYRNEGIEQVMWMATLESNTCGDCADLDGQIFNINSCPKLPHHPCCKCAFVPIVDGYTPKKRTDNVTKQTIDYVTYNQWQK